VTMQGEIRPGYKQTDVGVIPEDWSVSPLGAFGSFKGGNGFPLSYQGHEFGDHPFYKVSDMNNEGNTLFMGKSNHWITEATRKAIGARAFPPGSIIFAKIGAAIFLERKRILSQPSCIDNNVMALIFESDKADFRFFHYVFLTIELGKLVSATALPSLNGRDIAALNLAVPPPAEQRAIAAALADADGLIAALEGMIAKKRDLKQAAMQHLLTGKTRLPGFSGKWEVKRLGEVSVVDPENLGAGTDPSYRFNYISLEDVDHGILLGFSEVEFRIAPSRARRKVAADDILIATVRPNLKSHLYFSQKSPDWICSTGFAVVRCIPDKAHPQYVFQHVFGHLFSDQIEKLITGSNYPAISSNDVRALQIPMPPTIAEQTAIAEVLSDMDADLAAFEAQTAKARAVKQGMMQELLTGRVRLV